MAHVTPLTEKHPGRVRADTVRHPDGCGAFGGNHWDFVLEKSSKHSQLWAGQGLTACRVTGRWVGINARAPHRARANQVRRLKEQSCLLCLMAASADFKGWTQRTTGN